MSSDPRDPPDREANRLSARVGRYARVGGNVGGFAARLVGTRLVGNGARDRDAAQLRALLGGLKGPLMKVAQLLATIPDALPPEYAAELATLQANAPAMGRGFVRRRMRAELGPDWERQFARFDLTPTAAASLGQVHRATGTDGAELACKLQYPDMDSAVAADLAQLSVILALHRRLRPALDTREVEEEIGARVREELDYLREARHMAAYRAIFRDQPAVQVPRVVDNLSTRRLLTMQWLQGQPLLTYRDHPLADRNRLATAMFQAWWHPFAHFGVIHGDPHLGNYTVFETDGAPAGINLLDYGCVRIFPSRFVAGVVDLYRGLRDGQRDRVVAAYESWGFRGLSGPLIDALNIWARFIYGPLLEDRVRAIADGVSPAEYGRREAFRVHKALKEYGPVTVPREFVFMDRAAIGLGGVFLHLRAELNFYRLFNEQIEAFEARRVAERQARLLNQVGLEAAED